MKKALSLVLAALLLTALLAVGVMAGDLQEGVAVYGTPTVDGKIDEWANVPAYTVDRLKTGTATTITAQFRVMWDESHLYTLVEVKDPDHSFNGGPSVGDGCEVYVDLNNEKSGGFDTDTEAYTAVCANDAGYLTFDGSSAGKSYLEWGTVCALEETADGYNYEFVMDTATDFEVALSEGKVIGFDIQVNDQNENADARTAAYGWCDDTDMAWQSPASFGNITLTKDGSAPAAAAPAAPAGDLANYALNCPVEVSGLEAADTNLGEAAVDGDMTTRWSSDYVDDAYITIDLGSPKPVGYVELHWETAMATDYVIETGSTAGEVEHTVAEVTGNTSADCVYEFDTVTARYVTIRCSKRATEWGNSLYEIVVRKSADEVVSNKTEGYPSSGYTPKDGSTILDGTRIGLEVGWGDNAAAGCAAAFDGDPNTYFDPLGTGDGWAGIDAGGEYTLTAILIHPRDGQLPRFNGGTIEGSMDPEFNDSVAIWSSVEEASEFAWVTIDQSDFDEVGSFRYYRYINYTNHGDVGDIELYGYPSDGEYEKQEAARQEAAAKAAEEAAAKKAEQEAAKAAEAEAKAAEEAAKAAEEAAAAAAEAGEAVEAAADTAVEAVEEAKSGCGSFIGGGLIVLVTILGCGWMTSRKH